MLGSLGARHASIAVLTVLLVACGDGGDRVGDERADQLRQLATDAGLSDDVAEFFALASTGEFGTFQVTFEQDGRTLTLTQQPPNRRLDVSEGAELVESRVRLDSAGFLCTRADPDAELTCESADASIDDVGVFSDTALRAALAALSDSAAEYDFAVEDREIASTPATCLTTVRKPDRPENPALGDAGVMCLSDEGAVLLLEQPGARTEALGYTTDIPDGVFDLPE